MKSNLDRLKNTSNQVNTKLMERIYQYYEYNKGRSVNLTKKMLLLVGYDGIEEKEIRRVEK